MNTFVTVTVTVNLTWMQRNSACYVLDSCVSLIFASLLAINGLVPMPWEAKESHPFNSLTPQSKYQKSQPICQIPSQPNIQQRQNLYPSPVTPFIPPHQQAQYN